MRSLSYLLKTPAPPAPPGAPTVENFVNLCGIFGLPKLPDQTAFPERLSVQTFSGLCSFALVLPHIPSPCDYTVRCGWKLLLRKYGLFTTERLQDLKSIENVKCKKKNLAGTQARRAFPWSFIWYLLLGGSFTPWLLLDFFFSFLACFNFWKW